MGRWRYLAAATVAAVIVGVVPASRLVAVAGVGTASGAERQGPADARTLEVYYSNPVLVREGERVRIPVDVVCATAQGRSCAGRATLAIGREGRAPRSATAPASAGLSFDVSAVTRNGPGPIGFFVRAAGGSRAVTLPAGGPATAARFFVTDRMPVLQVPRVGFGTVRRGNTVLSLPWGTGAGRAGIELGRESVTDGPSSFDVDASGRVYLLDSLQQRLAVFAGGRLVRSAPVRMNPRADLAVTEAGAAYILDSNGPGVVVHGLDPSGRPLGIAGLGAAVPSRIREVGDAAFAQLLPQDQWIRVPALGRRGAGSTPTVAPSTGLPQVGGGQLLAVAREDGVRLGVAFGSRVSHAVELRSPEHFGELALNQGDGHGGYLVVVHLWRSDPTPADQYQFVHVVGDRVVQTFAMADQRFAECAPMSKFRVGGDGDLYQLLSGPSGMRIVRYELGRES